MRSQPCHLGSLAGSPRARSPWTGQDAWKNGRTLLQVARYSAFAGALEESPRSRNAQVVGPAPLLDVDRSVLCVPGGDAAGKQPSLSSRSTSAVSSVSAVYYVTDLRHFEGIDLDPTAPAPARALAYYLRRIVRTATATSRPGSRPTALGCRRRPQRRACPGHLLVERLEVFSSIEWACPACGESGRIDGWQEGEDDLSSLRCQPLAHEACRQLVISEDAYRLLLEEEGFDRRCARMVYAATAGRGGVLVSGTQEELAALLEVAGAAAASERSAARRRRWRQLAQSLEPEPRQASWLEQSIDVMADELDALGLSAPRAELGGMLQRTIAQVAERMGIGASSARRYLDDEQLRDLARGAALQLAPEQPGADLHGLARTIPVSLELLGRVVSALAEAARIRLLHGDEHGVEGALGLLSLLGQILHEAPSGQAGPIHLPQAALTRAGRLLEVSAKVVTAAGDLGPEMAAGARRNALARAFLADAATLRALVSEHGTSAGPTADS